MTNSRVVIVTGGGSGIGKAITERFADNGDQVIIIGRTEAKLQAVAQTNPRNITYEVADISQREQVERAIAHIQERHSRVDVLVNNAGFVRTISADMPLSEAEARWDAVMGANLKGAMLMAVGLAPCFTRPGGSIINIGSIAAYTGGSRGGVIGYGTAKAGLHGLTLALARELSPQGITVNTVSPGLVLETDFFGGNLSEARITSMVDQTPVGRAGVPSDIAEAVFYLASAGFVTGEVLHVNGGIRFGS